VSVAFPSLISRKGRPLPYYRLYFLDPETGHINRFEEYDASDDREALGLADRFADGKPIELWSGRRKVARLGAPEGPVGTRGWAGGRAAAPNQACGATRTPDVGARAERNASPARKHAPIDAS
jgi:hypothetical protein